MNDAQIVFEQERQTMEGLGRMLVAVARVVGEATSASKTFLAETARQQDTIQALQQELQRIKSVRDRNREPSAGGE